MKKSFFFFSRFEMGLTTWTRKIVRFLGSYKLSCQTTSANVTIIFLSDSHRLLIEKTIWLLTAWIQFVTPILNATSLFPNKEFWSFNKLDLFVYKINWIVVTFLKTYLIKVRHHQSQTWTFYKIFFDTWLYLSIFDLDAYKKPGQVFQDVV